MTMTAFGVRVKEFHNEKRDPLEAAYKQLAACLAAWERSQSPDDYERLQRAEAELKAVQAKRGDR
jgi:hypothetical protein